MSIRRNVNIAELNGRWTNLERCAEEAPQDTYEFAKEVAQLVSEVADDVLSRAKAIGLKCNNSDGLREFEAVLYGLLVDSNPDSFSAFVVSEGFGEHMAGPARDRVLAGAIRDRDNLKAAGIILPKGDDPSVSELIGPVD